MCAALLLPKRNENKILQAMLQRKKQQVKVNTFTLSTLHINKGININFIVFCLTLYIRIYTFSYPFTKIKNKHDFTMQIAEGTFIKVFISIM